MEVVKIPFKGWDLVAWINSHDGEHLIAVRPIAEAIGVDWPSQYAKLKKDSRFMCCDITMHDSSDRLQSMVCLPVRQLNGWLYGINANRVKPEIREKLIQFQEECHLAIYNHMSGSTAPEVLDLLYKTIAQLRETIELLSRENKAMRQELAGISERLSGLEDYQRIEASNAARTLVGSKRKRHLSLAN